MKKTALILILLLLPILGFSQYDMEDVESDSTSEEVPKINPYKLKEKIYVGSGLNALFGQRTFIYVSPFVGYEFTPKFSAGIGTMYQFYKENFNGGGYYHSIGGGIFVRYRPIEKLILETGVNRYSTTYNGQSDQKLSANSWMVGAGYANTLGNRSYYQILLQYDLFKNKDVPEPILFPFNNGGRIYYKFGLVFYLSS